jgi:hypothetical protein
MKIAMFYAKPYEIPRFDAVNAAHGHEITYLDVPLGRRRHPWPRGSMRFASS